MKKLGFYALVLVLVLAFGGAVYAAGTAGTPSPGTTGTAGTGTTGTALTSPGPAGAAPPAASPATSPSPATAPAPAGRADYGGNTTGDRYGTAGDGDVRTRGYGTNTTRARAADNRGGVDWGWLGLIGLFGLAGMRGRNKNDAGNQNRS